MIKINPNNNKFIVLLCLTITLLYFSPFLLSSLRGYHPELKFFGDLHLAGYPAFIQTGKYFDDLTFYGIDFYTANGSSSLFNRPNFTSYYLPQVILQSVVNVENNDQAATLFVFQMWISGFLAMLFTTLWLNRIIKVNIYASILGGAVFFSTISYVYTQIAFFNVASIFPMVVYFLSISILKDTDFFDKVLLSTLLVIILTAGYLPIAVMGVVVSIAFVLLYSISLPDIKPKYKDFFFVLLIGFFIIVGYLITVVNAVSITPTLPVIPFIEPLFFSDLSLTFKGVLSLFIPSVANDSGEAPHFRLGLPLLFLIYVSYKQLVTSGPQDAWKRNMFIISLVVFFSSILLAMGRYSGFADIFFYSVPGLGEMHIYARYMLIFVFFLALALALGMSNYYRINKNLSLKYPAFATMIGFLLILFFSDFLIKNQISVQTLFVELFMVVIIMLLLKLRGDDKLLLFLVPFIIFHQGALSYTNTNWTSLSNKGNSSIDIVHDSNRMNGLTNYFYDNTDKQFIKYIDLTPEIEKPGGVPQNFPWFIRYGDDNPRRISSYMGYDQGLSQQLEYSQKFSYFGTYDKKYLIESGVDYVIYDKKTKEKEKEWLSEIVDKSVVEYDIGHGYFAVKILQKKSDTKARIFDNGIFKTLTEDPDYIPGTLKTDWSSEITFETNSSMSQTVYFQLFPHKYWKYDLNGNTIPIQRTSSNLAYFDLPPGKNSLKISYSNLSNKLFVYVYMGFILLICLITIRNYINNKGFRRNA